jgi:hypothetical protein
LTLQQAKYEETICGTDGPQDQTKIRKTREKQFAINKHEYRHSVPNMKKETVHNSLT